MGFVPQAAVDFPADLAEQTKANMKSLAVFGMAGDSKYLGTEKGEIGVLKLGLHGSRMVGAISIEELVSRVHKDEATQKKMTSEELFEAVKGLSPEQVAGAPFVWAMVGSYDLVYVPQGWVTVEYDNPSKKDTVKEMSLGIKLNVMCPGIGAKALGFMKQMYVLAGKQLGADCISACLKICGGDGDSRKLADPAADLD